MRRIGLLTPLLLTLAACAGQSAPVAPRYSEAPAVALAFDPPILAGQPIHDFPRDIRRPSAFVGYDEVATTTVDIFTDDRQSSDPAEDRFLRESYTEKVAISTR
jgi:hypothetical protein